MIKSDPKRFFHYFEKFCNRFQLECYLMKIDLVIYLTVQILYLGKFFLLSYNLKGFQPISLQDSLITNTSCLNDLITLIFCMQKGSQNKKKISNFKGFQILNFHRVWSGMPKTAHNSRRCSEASQELQLHWKWYRMKNKVKRREFQCIFNSQFITTNPLVQSDCNIY